MRPGRSIAWRIRFALTSLASLALALSGLLTFYTYQRMEAAMVGDLTAAESRRMHARMTRTGSDRWVRPFERDFGPSLFVWGESERVRAPAMPAELRALPLGSHTLDHPGGTLHVIVSSARDGRLYVLYDTALLDRQHRKLALALGGIALGFSLLAFLISGRVASWLVSPLDAMTDRLVRWAPRGEVDDIESGDEAARLLEVFNRVQDQVDSAIADQREFSANLHHEIRTPLAVIQSDAEVMAIQGAMAPQEAKQRLRRIVASVDEIGQALESTYGLTHARADDASRVRLRDGIDDVIENLRPRVKSAGLELSNEVHPGHEETVSRPALLTVARNIIRNTAMHAAPATLTITSIPGGLHFTDSGPGIAPAHLPYVFDRYFSGRRRDLGTAGAGAAGMLSSGLGLAIAKRVCALQSWSLDVESPVADGRGTRFILRFREQH